MQHISCVSCLTSIVLYIHVDVPWQIKGGAQRPGSPGFWLKKKEKMQKEEKPAGQGILLKSPLP